MIHQRKSDFIFIALIILVHGCFFLLALHFKRIYNGDSFEYIYEAFNIKDGLFFYSGNPALPVREEYMSLRTPAYPLFLLFVYLFSVNNFLVLFVQSLVSIFNILYVRQWLLDYGYNKKYDWLFLVFCLGYPVQFVFAHTIAPDLLLQSFVLVYFRHSLLFLRNKTIRDAMIMSIALVVGLMVKPVLYPFVAVHFLMLTGYAAYHKVNFRKALLIAFLPVLCVGIYNTWNFKRTGKFHFTSIQSFNAIYYYHNYFRDNNSAEAAKLFLDKEREKINGISSFAGRYDYAHSRGLELLGQELVPYLKYHLKKSFLFFLEPGKGELDLFTGNLTLGNLYGNKTKGFRQVIKEEGVSGLVIYLSNHPLSFLAILVLVLNILKLAGVLAFLWLVRMPVILKWFSVLFLMYFALITGPISSAHYTLPVSLVLIGWAVLGFQSLLHRPEKNGIITAT